MSRGVSKNNWMKEARHYRSHLEALTTAVMNLLTVLDSIMEQPSTLERGRNMARWANNLEMVNDRARHFGLGIDLKKDKKPK